MFENFNKKIICAKITKKDLFVEKFRQQFALLENFHKK